MKQPIHQRILDSTINIHNQKPKGTPQPSSTVPAELPRLLRHASVEIIPVPEFLSQLLTLCSLGLVPPLRDTDRLLNLVEELLQVLECVASEVSLLAHPGIRHETSIHTASLVSEASCFDEELVRSWLIGMQ
jgi:hypothetical protein